MMRKLYQSKTGFYNVFFAILNMQVKVVGSSNIIQLFRYSLVKQV